MKFELLKGSALGPRLGRVSLANGFSFETPVFMPVATQATVKALSTEDMLDCGASMLLANTYHLSLRPGLETIREAGGLHRFMNWDRGILTDSGGFQVMSLSHLVKLNEHGAIFRSHIDGSLHNFTPEIVVGLQHAFGVDAVTCLDVCKGYPVKPEEIREALELTMKWAKRSFDEHRRFNEESWGILPRSVPLGDRDSVLGSPEARLRMSVPEHPPTPHLSSSRNPLLFGIIQGGFEEGTRKEAAQRMVDIGFKAFAIGGLSVQEPKEITWEMTKTVCGAVPSASPRYLMGVGDPLDFLEACRWGVDMTDCVLPTRNARNGQALTSGGKLYIKNSAYRRDQGPLDPDCDCLTCRSYSRSYLCHLFHAEEMLLHRLLSLHNIAFMIRLNRLIQEAIREGKFDEFYSRFRAHYLPVGVSAVPMGSA